MTNVKFDMILTAKVLENWKRCNAITAICFIVLQNNIIHNVFSRICKTHLSVKLDRLGEKRNLDCCRRLSWEGFSAIVQKLNVKVFVQNNKKIRPYFMCTGRFLLIDKTVVEHDKYQSPIRSTLPVF